MAKADVTTTETKVLTLSREEVEDIVTKFVARHHGSNGFHNVETEIDVDNHFTCRVTMRITRLHETREESFI